MKRFLDALSSMRLAIGLIVYLSVAGVVATVLPPGTAREGARNFRPPATILFVLVPVLIFLANLSTCAARRFLRQLRAANGKRFGPDILHLGLVLLVVGGLWSWSGRVERSATIEAGEGARLPDGSVLALREMRQEAYADGRPHDWVAVVDLSRDGEALVRDYELRVNKPLRHAGLGFYLSAFVDEWSLVVIDAAGAERSLSRGDELAFGQATRVFLGVENPEGPDPGHALIRATEPGREARTLRIPAGGALDGLEVSGLRRTLATRIDAVSDPAYPLSLAALALVAIGSAWTFLGKLKEAT
ncbi:MAG: cytochrome c biogenesis protein ResB [Spirochaetales bacterium]|nr:cytochrome c biogenesis protein ResB [Spirochaetales bacterium]